MSRDEKRQIGGWFAWMLVMAHLASRIGDSAGSLAMGFSVFLTMVLAEPVNAAIHEAGHVLAAKAVGFRVLKAEVGKGAPLVTLRWADMDIWLRRYIVLGGQTTYMPGIRSRWREVVTTLGGVSANLTAILAVAVTGFALEPHLPEAAKSVAGALSVGLVLSNAWDVVNNLWPRRGQGDQLDSDGAQLLDILGRKPQGLPVIEGVPPWRIEAVLLDRQRRYAEALAIYEREFAARPRSPELLNMVLHLTLHLHGGDAALDRYVVALGAKGGESWEDGSENAQAWLDANLAWAMLHADRTVDLNEVERLVERSLAHDQEALELRATRAALGIRRGHVEPGEVVLFDSIRRTETPVDRAAFARFLAREATRRGADSAEDYSRLSAQLDRAVS